MIINNDNQNKWVCDNCGLVMLDEYDKNGMWIESECNYDGRKWKIQDDGLFCRVKFRYVGQRPGYWNRCYCDKCHQQIADRLDHYFPAWKEAINPCAEAAQKSIKGDS